MSLWMIPAALSVFGGLSDANNARENRRELGRLADQQQLMVEQNAILDQRELDENIRRQKKADDRVSASARARAGASGARVEGSVSGAINQLTKEQKEQLDWTADAGASRIRLKKQQGELEVLRTRIGASQKDSFAITGLLQGLSVMGQGGLFSSGPTTWKTTNVSSSYTDYS